MLLDRVLAHYGPEATDMRASLRASGEHWAEVLQPGSGLRPREFVIDQIRHYLPKTTIKRTMKAQASSLAIQMGQIRWLIFAQNTIPVSKPLLLVLLFWLTMLFISFGRFAPRNLTVRSGLFVSALTVAGAIFLILEMYHPHGGLIDSSV